MVLEITKRSHREVEDSICPTCGKSTYIGETINCESCTCWFHFECVGVTKQDKCVRNIDVPYSCPPCSSQITAFGKRRKRESQKPGILSTKTHDKFFSSPVYLDEVSFSMTRRELKIQVPKQKTEISDANKEKTIEKSQLKACKISFTEQNVELIETINFKSLYEKEHEQYGQLTRNMENFSAEFQKQKNELQKMRHVNASLIKQNERKHAECEKLKKEKEKIETDLQKAVKFYLEEQSNHQKLKIENSKTKAELQKIAKLYEEEQSEHAKHQNENNKTKTELRNMVEQYVDEKKDYDEKIRKQINEKEKVDVDLQRKERKLTEMTTRYNDKSASFDKVLELVNQYKKDNDQYQTEMKALHSENKTLRANNELFENKSKNVNVEHQNLLAMFNSTVELHKLKETETELKFKQEAKVFAKHNKRLRKGKKRLRKSITDLRSEFEELKWYCREKEEEIGRLEASIIDLQKEAGTSEKPVKVPKMQGPEKKVSKHLSTKLSIIKEETL